MINHTRTLLLNVRGEGYTEFPGEAYVSPSFSPLDLSRSYLSRVMRALFGESPDRLMRNYRLQQLLTLLHTPEFETHVLSYDPRITYSMPNSSMLLAFADQVSVSPSTLSPPTLSIATDFLPRTPDITGQAQFQFVVQNSGPTSITIATIEGGGGTAGLPVTHTVSYTNGLSSPVSLGASGRQLRVPQTDFRYLITVRNRPQDGLADLLTAVESLGSETIAKVFGTSGAVAVQEPWATYWNLWTQSGEVPLRMGGFLLAVVRRLHLMHTMGAA